MNEMESEYQKRLRLFQEHVVASERSAAMLKSFHDRLIAKYPFKVAEIENIGFEDEMLIFAMFKKFEQLVVLMNDNILKNIPYFDLENTAKMSRFDTIIYAEKVGILKTAQRFIDAVALRNQLAHEYPLNSTKQTALINNVLVEADVLLRAFVDLKSYVENRLPNWLQVRKAGE